MLCLVPEKTADNLTNPVSPCNYLRTGYMHTGVEDQKGTEGCGQCFCVSLALILHVIIRGYICWEKQASNVSYDSFDDYMFSYKQGKYYWFWQTYKIILI